MSEVIAIAEIPDFEQYPQMVEAAARLLSQVVGCETIDALLQEASSDPTSHIFVAATKPDILVGAAIIYSHDASDYVCVDEVGVLPSYQGRYVGSALMAAIETFARNHGKRYLTLTPVNESADFYRKQGYTVTVSGEDLDAEKILN